MPTTWTQWGIAGTGVYPNTDTLHLAVPHTEAPPKWCDGYRHKMRIRYCIEDPAGDGFEVYAKLDSLFTNDIYTSVPGPTAVGWTSTWANADEHNEHPTGIAMPLPDFDPEKAPHYMPSKLNVEWGTSSVILYGVEVGIVNDSAYDASADRMQRTPRTGASIKYDEYNALCSYMNATILAAGYNKLVESARWRISGPFMGTR